GHKVSDLDKVSVEFFRLDVPHRQGAQTGGIGEIAANVQLDQLAVAGGVNAFPRVTADILDRTSQPRRYLVEQAGFAHAGRSGKDRDLITQQVAQRVDARAVEGAGGKHRIAE